MGCARAGATTPPFDILPSCRNEPMTNPRRPFRINVGFIVHEEVGYAAEFPFEFEKIKLGDDLELRDFTGLVEISRTPQGLLMTGNFTGTTSLECARCL